MRGLGREIHSGNLLYWSSFSKSAINITVEFKALCQSALKFLSKHIQNGSDESET